MTACTLNLELASEQRKDPVPPELSLQMGSLPSAPRSNSGKSRALSKLR